MISEIVMIVNAVFRLLVGLMLASLSVYSLYKLIRGYRIIIVYKKHTKDQFWFDILTVEDARERKNNA